MGDLLELAEWDPEREEFTGHAETMRVTYVQDLGPIGCAGFVGLAIVRPEAAP